MKDDILLKDRIENYLYWAEYFEQGFNPESDTQSLERVYYIDRRHQDIKMDDVYYLLFHAPADDLVPPWESVYKNVEGTIMDQTTLDVQRAYAKWGIQYRLKESFPSDHISVELKFMLWLIAVEKNQDLSYWHEKSKIMQKLFLEEHLLPLITGMYKRFQMIEAVPYKDDYDRIFQTLMTFIESEIIIMDASINVTADETSYINSAETLGFDAVITHHQKKAIDMLGIFEWQSSDERADLYNETYLPFAGINNCGGTCSIMARINGNNVLEIASNEAFDAVNIKACVRGRSYRKTYLSPKRLKYPLKRIGKRGEGKFMRISWEEAINTMASENQRIKSTYGPVSRYVTYATGVQAILRGDQQVKRLLALDEGYLNYHNSYSTACISATTPYTFGNQFSGHSTEDLLNAKLVILWGHNPAATGFSPKLIPTLMKAKENGTKIVVVDPRYTETAIALADWWIPIKPTTDSALVDAMAYVIIKNGDHDQAFLDRYCLGFDDEHMPEGIDGNESYKAYVMGTVDGQPKTPEWASEITGLSAEDIERFANMYAAHKPAALIQGYGPQRNANGEQTVRSIQLLCCITGNVGIAGGSSGGGSCQIHQLPQIVPIVNNPIKDSIPCFLWTDAIYRSEEMCVDEDGLKGCRSLSAPIKMIWNIAGNALINQHSDINQTINILEDDNKCEFIVCSDVFLTASAKYADLLLPAASMFESENIKKQSGSFGSYILYGNQVRPPLFESRFEYDWLVTLSEKMGVKNEFTAGRDTLSERLKDAYEALKLLEGELPSYDIFKAEGGYVFKDNPIKIAYKEQIESPEQYPFETPSGKIELFSMRLFSLNRPDDIPAVPKYVPAFEGLGDPNIDKYPFQLIGWHSVKRTHSIHDFNEWTEAVEPQRIWMHPDDAEALGISDDDLIGIYNDRGEMHLKVRLTRQIRRSVLGISQGAWYKKNEDGIEVGGNLNVLSTLRPTPLVKGNPQHSNLVAVKGVIHENNSRQ